MSNLILDWELRECGKQLFRESSEVLMIIMFIFLAKAAPAQVNDRGHLIGHSHVVIQFISSLSSTDVPDPRKFAFFQGLNAQASNSILTATVTNGLPAGTYRLGSITTAANHQPALVAVAQHGMLDDTVYFTVNKANGANTKNSKLHNRAAESAIAVNAAAGRPK